MTPPKRRIDDKNGFVRYKFFISTMVGLVVACFASTWVLINAHAERPHEGVATIGHVESNKKEWRDEMKELRRDIKEILRRMPRL